MNILQIWTRPLLCCMKAYKRKKKLIEHKREDLEEISQQKSVKNSSKSKVPCCPLWLLIGLLALLFLSLHQYLWDFSTNIHFKWMFVALISVLSHLGRYQTIIRFVSIFYLQEQQWSEKLVNSKASKLIVHPSMSMTFIQNPCETIRNSLTTYEIDGSKLIERTGILGTQRQEINLLQLEKRPTIQRRFKHRLVDIFKTIFGQSPLFLADIYVDQGIKCIILKSVPHAHTVAQAIYSKGK